MTSEDAVNQEPRCGENVCKLGARTIAMVRKMDVMSCMMYVSEGNLNPCFIDYGVGYVTKRRPYTCIN